MDSEFSVWLKWQQRMPCRKKQLRRKWQYFSTVIIILLNTIVLAFVYELL